MTFQAGLCETFGGGLYRSKDSLFCAGCENGVWRFPEVLPFRGSTSCTKVASPFGTTEPKGLRSLEQPYLASGKPLPEGLIWNLTFD